MSRGRDIRDSNGGTLADRLQLIDQAIKDLDEHVREQYDMCFSALDRIKHLEGRMAANEARTSALKTVWLNDGKVEVRGPKPCFRIYREDADGSGWCEFTCADHRIYPTVSGDLQILGKAGNEVVTYSAGTWTKIEPR